MTFKISKCHLSKDYRFLKELKARNLFHTSVLTDESKLNEYGTTVWLTWGGDVSALHFFFGVTDTERVKRHQVAENIQLTGNPQEKLRKKWLNKDSSHGRMRW